MIDILKDFALGSLLCLGGVVCWAAIVTIIFCTIRDGVKQIRDSK